MDQRSQAISELMGEGNPGGWLVTYADLMTLLLTFFILLFSISSMNLEKFKQAIAAIQVSLGEKTAPVALLELIPQPHSMVELASTPRPTGRRIALENVIGLKTRDIYRDVQRVIYKRNLSDHIVVSIERSKVVIRVTGKVLFESAVATFSLGAKPILDDIIEVAENYPQYNVRIEGHTDDLPISTPQFASNWELSAVRATTVLRYLIEGGIDPHRLTATGYGALMPLVSNDTPTGRSRNRRVEFVLEKQAE
jgi:chemotaxis protein MotB